jgi:two-component system, LytTR family, sensor kinase
MPQKNTTPVILLGALAITILMNFQRGLLILVNQKDFAANFGVTLEALLLRMLFFFGYACLLLSFNILWKERSPFLGRKASHVLTNLGIFLLGVMVTATVMANFLSDGIEQRHVFVIITTDFLIVHPILLLFARFIKLNVQQQQLILEKEQAKQSALQHQLEALRSQINPHFLFNALNSLAVLIRTQSDRALPFVDQLSWLLRATLLRSEDDFISIQHEQEYLESYVFLQKERFGDKFKVDIQIPEAWKRELIPSFSLQLLAENAIKHNVVSSQQPLLLEIYPNGDSLIIRNQIQKRRDATQGTGLGLLNLSVRFKLLKKRDIQISQDSTYFTVKLPILKHEGHHH